jgi:hypothetical protein
LDVAGYSTKANSSVSAFERNKTYSSQPTVLQDDVLAHTRSIQLGNPTNELENFYVEVRIEADYYCLVVKWKKLVKISPSLVVLPAVFCWILSGNRSGTTVNRSWCI